MIIAQTHSWLMKGLCTIERGAFPLEIGDAAVIIGMRVNDLKTAAISEVWDKDFAPPVAYQVGKKFYILLKDAEDLRAKLLN